MFKRTLCVFVFALVFFLLPRPAHAARSLAISADKNVLSGDEELTITTVISGFTSGETITVKGAFYQDGSTNYFGFTKSGDNWIKNGDPTASQRKVIIGDWDGKLTVKSDFGDSGFIGEGEYKFKVGFYYTTTGGNLSSVNWSDFITIQINQPDPTPTPIPTLTPTPKVSPTPTPKAANTPVSAKNSQNNSSGSGEVLTQETSDNPNSFALDLSGDSQDEGKVESEKSSNKIGAIFLILGGLLLFGAIGFRFWKVRKSKKVQAEP